MSDNNIVLKDVFNMLCGEQIGSGSARVVYRCELDKEMIVKVEAAAGSFQNIVEWETWNRVKGTRYERWFAPCLRISPTGTVLVMARTIEPLNSQFPKKLPVFLTDTKRANYGIYKNKFVCHDYGTNLLMEYGMCDKTRRAEWWEK